MLPPAPQAGFIYREEQYNKSEENKNIADPIVAKQKYCDHRYMSFDKRKKYVALCK